MRMLTILALGVAVSSTAALAATESRKVADFAGIEVGGGVTLEVKKGATSLTLDGAPDVIKAYQTEVKDGVLHIRNTSKSWFKNQDITIRVTTPSLSRLEASGGVHATLTDVAAPKFAAELSGGVEFEAPKLAVDTLDLNASGGVNMTLSGKARDVRMNLSGGVELKGQSLEIAQATVNASGGCTVDVTIKESVAGEISGGVGLKVRGSPPKSRVHASGGADVQYVD